MVSISSVVFGAVVFGAAAFGAVVFALWYKSKYVGELKALGFGAEGS